MEIQFYGANCVRLSTKTSNLIVDDNLIQLGLKAVTKAEDIALYTHTMDFAEQAKLVIDQPGEYEVSNTSIQGIAARAFTDNSDQQTATMFKVVSDDIRVAIVGHIHPKLSDTQLESLGTIDVLILPLGNAGYTLDSVGALQLIKQIEPKIIIPTHFADKALQYSVAQQGLAEALKGLSMEPRETLDKLKIKPEILTEATELVVLNRQ